MNVTLRFLAGWLFGASVTTVLAVIGQTQIVLARLNAVGAEITLGDRLSMTAYDLIHLGSIYGIIIFAGTLIAYLAGLLVYRAAGFGRPVVFITAGTVAMVVMLLAMKAAFFDITLIAGARGPLGLSLQLGAGAVGGWAFAGLTQRLKVRQSR